MKIASLLRRFASCLLVALVQGQLIGTEFRVEPINLIHPSRAARSTGNGESTRPMLRGNGRWVFFSSAATDLVTNDANGVRLDVLRRDMDSGQMERVSLGSSGQSADESALLLDVTADGSKVLFASLATSLVPSGGSGVWSLYVRDLTNRTTTRVSAATNDAQGLGDAFTGFFSPDGASVVFESFAPDLVDGDRNGVGDVFRRPVSGGAVERLSVGPDGEFATGGRAPTLSADGRWLVFHVPQPLTTSPLTNVPPRLPTRLFRRDLQTGVSSEVFVDTSADARWSAVVPWSLTRFALASYSLNADGRYLIGVGPEILMADGGATNLVNALLRIDLVDGRTEIIAMGSQVPSGVVGTDSDLIEPSNDGAKLAVVMRSSVATNANLTIHVWTTTNGLQPLVGFDHSIVPRFSPDGRKLAFLATQNADGDLAPDELTLHVRDLETGVDRLIVEGMSETPLNDFELTPDGAQIAWSSRVSNVADDDENNAYDVFLTDVATSRHRLVSAVAHNGGLGLSRGQVGAGGLQIAGSEVFFISSADDLVTNDFNGGWDLFVRNLAMGSTRLAMVGADGRALVGGSADAVVAGDGRTIVFRSRTDGIVPGDTNQGLDHFVLSRATGEVRLLQVDQMGEISRLLHFDPSGDSLLVRSPRLGIYDIATGTLRTLPPSGPVVSGSWPLLAGTRRGSATYLAGSALARVDLFGSGPQPPQIRLPGFGAAFSRDGDVVAYSVGGQLFVTNLFRGSGRRIWFGTDRVTDVQMSPGGNAVAIEVLQANGLRQVFATGNLTTGLVLLSRTPAGQPGNGTSTDPVISPDGRYVAFASTASDLVPGDTNSVQDIFVGDLWTGSLTRLDVPREVFEVGRASSTIRWGPDSRRLAFVAFEMTPSGRPASLQQALVMVTLTPEAVPDADGDQLPDGWELSWFGDLSRDGAADGDMDGVSDLGEFVAGTWPLNPDSVLSNRPLLMSADRLDLSWDSIAGVRYRLSRAQTLGGAWTEPSDGVTGTGGAMSLRIPVEAGVSAGLFRITATR
jgi:Tol biopolymer transport system component